MKIGILTFHRAHNYGAVLQCYALQERLKMAGYDVSVIDYRQPAIERAYKCFDVLYLLKNVFHLKNLMGKIKYYISLIKYLILHKLFLLYYSTHLHHLLYL